MPHIGFLKILGRLRNMDIFSLVNSKGRQSVDEQGFMRKITSVNFGSEGNNHNVKKQGKCHNGKKSHTVPFKATIT